MDYSGECIAEIEGRGAYAGLAIWVSAWEDRQSQSLTQTEAQTEAASPSRQRMQT